jgi:glyoxylase-like metal-dependent hydrolase (beta-lactamase superfamily II)
MSNKQSFSMEHFKGDPLDRDLYTTSQMSERALNAAIVEADIEQGYEKYLAIFEAFYGDEIEVSSETADEPIRGKNRVRSLLGNFLYPVHVMTEVGGLTVTHTDTDNTTCLHVPSAGLVVAGDAAYNDVHLYLAESNAQTRREWIAALDTIEALKPRAVIAGHKKAEREDSPRIIEETRQYIRDFERLAEATTTARELYDKMLALYPNRANPGSLWGSARVVKG